MVLQSKKLDILEANNDNNSDIYPICNYVSGSSYTLLILILIFVNDPRCSCE